MKILITGATDGIGLETSKVLASKGHELLIHGRNPAKLNGLKEILEQRGVVVHAYLADLSKKVEVQKFVEGVLSDHEHLDVLINNAGVYMTHQKSERIDIRFTVNTFAPFYLAEKLRPIIQSGRIVNLSSAAQARVDFDAVRGLKKLEDSEAYAQSKLALTMWSCYKGQEDKETQWIAVNPKSFLASKMVKEAYGTKGYDLNIGADILVRASLSEDFSQAGGRYYDNDIKAFASPHPDAVNKEKCQELIKIMREIY